MKKFEYKRYCYKFLHEKKYLRLLLTNPHLSQLSTVYGTYDRGEVMSYLMKSLKAQTEYHEKLINPNFSFDDYDYEWEVITPDKTYISRSDETGN